MDERIKAYDVKMTKSYNNLLEEFGAIRAGRANPHVLDRITVEYYGTPTPLQQVGNVTVPEPRMIQIQPWDASLIKEICKAIQTSDLGINPNTDGKVIRLVFPELTEERRKDLVKEVKKKARVQKLLSAISDVTQTMHSRNLEREKRYPRTKSKSWKKMSRS